MSRPVVALLPGNGFAPVRVEPARSALAAAGEPFDLVAVAYPPAGSFDALLDRLAEELAAAGPAVIHATGIGGLVALALRARGQLLSTPLVLQGAVLWGLERRRFPRLMRLPGMTGLLVRLLRLGWTRRRFAAKHFESEPAPEFLARFFDGYDDADEFSRWFRWLDADLLRRLERSFAGRPEALDGIELWWGRRDSVVGLEELRITERALGRTFPVRCFDAWGHYPMIDAPAEWVREVTDGLEAAVAVR